MSDPHVNAVVEALLHARESRHQAEAGEFSETLSSAEQAYAVQDGVAQALHWFGPEGPMHWKSGGPSRQATLTHAPLPPAGIWNSPATAGAFAFSMRGIEAEVALRLGQSVNAEQAATLDASGASALIEAM
ncbi:MAG: 2-keto-4-pentenoate hydratase, partial [Polaromonas sp.]